MSVESITPWRNSCPEVGFYVPFVICAGLIENSQGTRVAWGLNMGDRNLTNKVEMAQSIFRAFSPRSKTTENGVTLELIELGMSSEPLAPAILTRQLRGRK